jgi:hypothetical protein
MLSQTIAQQRSSAVPRPMPGAVGVLGTDGSSTRGRHPAGVKVGQDSSFLDLVRNRNRGREIVCPRKFKILPRSVREFAKTLSSILMPRNEPGPAIVSHLSAARRHARLGKQVGDTGEDESDPNI